MPGNGARKDDWLWSEVFLGFVRGSPRTAQPKIGRLKIHEGAPRFRRASVVAPQSNGRSATDLKKIIEGMSTQIQFAFMPPFRFSRVAAIGATLFAATLVPAFADEDASHFIDSIYDHGHEDAVWLQWLNRAKRSAWFSRDLTALWSRCDARARQSKDQMGALDFDIATNSQLGWDSFKGYAVSVVSTGDGRAAVNARLKTGANTDPPKFDSDNVIRYDLVQEGGAWKIDDVRSTTDGKPWSLRELLKYYLKN